MGFRVRRKSYRVDVGKVLCLDHAARSATDQCFRPETLVGTEQFDRFRAGGLAAVTRHEYNKDDSGCVRPLAEAVYTRVKGRNASNPIKRTEEFELVITCLCPEGHQPIDIKFDKHGCPAGEIKGNLDCWFGLYEFITKDLTDNSKKLIQNWNMRKKAFGTQTRSASVVQGCVGRWCELCGVCGCSLPEST